MKPAIAILMSNLLVTSTGFAAVSLSRGDNPIQPIGLIALGLVLVAGIPLLIARLPSYEAGDFSSTTTASAVFGMVHLP